MLADLPAGALTLATNASATPAAGTPRCATTAGKRCTAASAHRPARPHHYLVTVHALGVDSLATLLPPNPSAAMVGFFINNTRLGKASLTVLGKH